MFAYVCVCACACVCVHMCVCVRIQDICYEVVSLNVTELFMHLQQHKVCVHCMCVTVCVSMCVGVEVLHRKKVLDNSAERLQQYNCTRTADQPAN